MKRFLCTLFGALSVVPSLLGQCPGGLATTYASAYAVRAGNVLTTYTRAYTTGGDANYITTGITQTDTLNGVQFAPAIQATAGPNQVAQATRNTDINGQGFGTYAVRGEAFAYDSCNGRKSPPLR